MRTRDTTFMRYRKAPKHVRQDDWMFTFDRVVRRRAKKQPSWQHWAAGHMYMGQGLSPTAAASKFLRSTKWGLKRALRKTKHRRSR